MNDDFEGIMRPNMMKKNDNYEVAQQFDDLISDPNGVAKVKDMLQSFRMNQNTMTLTEFQKYECIFRYETIKEMGEEAYKDLVSEYYTRICPFDPVMLVDDNNNLILTLPPIFSRNELISNTGQVGIDIGQAFINVNKNDMSDLILDKKKAQYLQLYKQLLEVSQNTEEKQRVKQLSDEMTKNAMNIVNSGNLETYKESESEIEDISSVDFKENEITPLSNSNNTVNLQESDDEFEIL